MKILFTGGGTGGHIFPIIAIVRELKKISKEKLEIFYIGPKDEFAEIFLSMEEIERKYILAGKWRRYTNFQSVLENIIDLLKIPIGFFQALVYLLLLYPDLIFSKGGFGSLPVVIAGWLLRIPIFLHESDVLPGFANKTSSFFASKIFISFPKTIYLPPKKIILSGNPIRKEILNARKEEGIEFFKLSGKKPVVLILGGSQGAQRINDKILNIINELLENFEIIHQVGEKNQAEIKKIVDVIVKPDLKNFYHYFPFLREEQLKKAYAVADLIISRAGSGTIFEIAAWGKPSILIPLPESAQNHQVKNAYAYAETGAAIVLEEENFSPRFLLEKLKILFSNADVLDEMSKKAKEFAKIDAAKIIGEYIYSFLTQ